MRGDGVAPVASVARMAWRNGDVEAGSRIVPEETPVALTYQGSTQAVMMATPADLEDFAVGFSLNEGFIATPDDIASLEIIALPEGMELRMWLSAANARAFTERRRYLAGPTGCGLCGIDSLSEAIRQARPVGSTGSFTADMIAQAMAAMAPAQTLNRETRAMHAAAYWQPDKGLVALREDVGRHNALDKLAGALARAGQAASTGMILLTSRVSVEMVQKAAAMGAPVVVAVSAPTALAIRTADAAGMTLAAVAREGSFEIFCHPGRIIAAI